MQKFTMVVSSVLQCWLPMRNHELHHKLRNYPSRVIGGEIEGGVLLEIQNKYNAYIELIVGMIKGVGDIKIIKSRMDKNI